MRRTPSGNSIGPERVRDFTPGTLTDPPKLMAGSDL